MQTERSSQTAPAQWVPALLSALGGNGIRHLVLRNYETLPEQVGNDLDLLVEQDRQAEAFRVAREALEQCGLRAHHAVHFGCLTLFVHDPDDLRQYHVDFFSSISWRGMPILDATRLLERSVSHHDIPIPHPSDEAVTNLLQRLLYGGRVREKYRPKIAGCATRSDFRATLDHVLGTRLSGKMLRLVIAGRWDEAEALRGACRRAVIRGAWQRSPFGTMAGILREGRRLLRRWLCPPGLMVVLMGPDGCGKSTVATGLRTALAGTFHPERGDYVHWKPRLRRPGTPGAVHPNPHDQPSRSSPIAVCFLLAHALELLLAHLLFVHPRLSRNGLVVVDRSFADLLVDPARYRYGGPLWLVKCVLRCLPRSDLVLCLDASSTVLQARKPEVPEQESARQREAYRRLVSSLPQGYVLDAEQPAQRVVESVARQVIQCARERLKSASPA